MNDTTEVTAPTFEIVVQEQVKEQRLDGGILATQLSGYQPFFNEAHELTQQAKKLKVIDAADLDGMAKAKKLRLALVKVRTGTDRLRKELKDKSLRESRAVDGMANVLKFMVEPVEEQLMEMEKLAERQQAERRAKLKAEREALLAGVCDDTSVYILEAMDQEDFDQLLENLTARKEARIAAEKKAEEERIAKEAADRAEHERIRAENERLRLENERIAAERKAEQEAAEAQQKEMEAAAAKEWAEAQANLAAERAEAQRKADEAAAAAKAEQDRIAEEAAKKLAEERRAALQRETELAAKVEAARRELERQQEIEREKAEAELQAQRDAEDARIAAEEEARKKAESAPDREKLEKFATALQDRIVAASFLPMTSEKGKIVAETVRVKLSDVVRYVNSQLSNL